MGDTKYRLLSITGRAPEVFFTSEHFREKPAEKRFNMIIIDVIKIIVEKCIQETETPLVEGLIWL